MTIAISVRVGEGLVYAADSTTSLFTTIGGVSVLSQSFHHAQKLVQIREFPVGVLTYGLALIGTRNVESLVSEFESEVLAGDAPCDVKAIAQGLLDFLGAKYDEAISPPAGPDEGAEKEGPAIDNRPRLGVVVGGYSGHQFFPEEYSFELPDKTLVEIEPRSSGVHWWGQTEALQRLVLGLDIGKFAEWLREQEVDDQGIRGVVEQLRERMGWRISFDGMPIQDAIDLAVFLTNIAIGHSRFVIGPPVCGGHVDVAAISHRGFNWVRRKSFEVKTDSTFF